MKNKFLLILIILLSVFTAFSQSLQLTSLSPDVFCGTGRDTMKFSVNYTNIPPNSNVVFYQSTNPAFNPYAGQGDSIAFINVGANTSGGGGQVTTTCPEILGIFFDACNTAPYVEANNEYVVITSGNSGIQVNNLIVRLPNTNINTTPGSFTFVTPPAAMMTLLRNGSCTGSTLIAADQSSFIPANAIVIIFTLSHPTNPVFPYNFSSYCSSGQPIYILLNSNPSGTASFLNAVQPPAASCPNVYRTTSIQYGSCRDALTYAPCSLPIFDNTNPNVGDGNYAIHLPNTDTSSLTNGGIRNNASDKCNGLRFDSISGATIIKFPIPNDGSANPVTNFCNTGYHYIKAITHPNGSQPVSNTIQFKLICLDVATNVNNLSFCSGGNAAINISSTDPNASFSWTVSGGAGITGASAGTGNTINQTLNYSGATKDSLTYNITATDGICTKTTSVKVVVNKCNTCNAFNLGNDTSYCGPFTRVLKTGNATSVWSTGVTADSITVSSLGMYYATCGVFTDTIKFTPAPGINFDFGSNTTSVCVGSSISLDASTAYDSYVWSTGASTHSISISTPGKYWVDVFKNGCKGSDTITVIQIDKEPKPNLGIDITVCSPVSEQLSTGNTNTTWYLTSTANQVGTGVNYTATQFGKFIAKVSNSCGDVFDTIEIKQTTTQQPFNLGRDTNFCGIFSDTLRTGNAATVWSTGATAAFIVVTTPGKYYATINVGCGIASDTINITQSSGVTFDFGSNSTSVCVGGSISLGAGNTFDNYVWSTGAVTNSISITRPGIYWVDVFKNGCKASDTITVIQIDKEPKPNLGRDSTYCGNFSRTLSTGNAQTQWFKNFNSTPFITAASVAIDQSVPGTYVAKITNSCGSVADTIVISIANALNVNLGRDTAICNGSSLTLRATVPGSSISYLWNTGAITPTISVNQFGKYDVTVSNGTCTVTDTIFVDVLDKPTIISLGNDTTICGDFSLQLFTGDAGTIWSTNAVGPQINVTKPATYIAENKNVCGSAKDTIVVTQFALPLVNLGKDTTICDSIVLSVGNGSFATILWNTGDTTSSIIVNASGVYQVKVSNANCTNTDSVKVNKDCFYDVYIPTAFSPNGDTINDIYVPISDVKGMLVIDFVIFNRWGEKVFESENFVPRDATKGWDGTFKGQPAQQDSYVYFFTAKMPDGEVKVYKGTFTLLR
ncbi:MAG: gliding motility-associated C-terminal domain-containing protein [Sphingobacteriales bacterium]|nr:gliding motility-associated C-terminal domain-containing protein [Sphingobacteriales bacterium]